MKLKQAHLFYILLGVLLLSCLGSTIHEGFREGQQVGGGKYESTPPEKGGPWHSLIGHSGCCFPL